MLNILKQEDKNFIYIIMKDKIFEEKIGITFDKFYKNNYNFFMNYFYSYQRFEFLQEIVNDAFVNFYNHIEKFDTEKSNARTYVFKMIKNHLYQIHTRTKIHYIEIDYNIAELIEEEDSDEEKIINDIKILDEIVSLLNDKDQEIYNLRFIQMKSYDNICEELNIKLHICKNRIHKCKLNIKKSFEERKKNLYIQ